MALLCPFPPNVVMHHEGEWAVAYAAVCYRIWSGSNSCCSKKAVMVRFNSARSSVATAAWCRPRAEAPATGWLSEVCSLNPALSRQYRARAHATHETVI